MSWDVILMNAPKNIKSPNDLPHDFKPSLGMASDILSTLSNIEPEIDLHDPTWGDLEGDGFSIEFNIGGNNPVEAITLHVRGNDGAIDVIRNICDKTGWRAFDTSMGNFIDFAQNPAEGLTMWRGLRNQVVGSLQSKGKKTLTDVKVVSSSRKRRWQFWK